MERANLEQRRGIPRGLLLVGVAAVGAVAYAITQLRQGPGGTASQPAGTITGVTLSQDLLKSVNDSVLGELSANLNTVDANGQPISWPYVLQAIATNGITKAETEVAFELYTGPPTTFDPPPFGFGVSLIAKGGETISVIVRLWAAKSSAEGNPLTNDPDELPTTLESPDNVPNWTLLDQAIADQLIIVTS